MGPRGPAAPWVEILAGVGGLRYSEDKLLQTPALELSVPGRHGHRSHSCMCLPRSSTSTLGNTDCPSPFLITEYQSTPVSSRQSIQSLGCGMGLDLLSIEVRGSGVSKHARFQRTWLQGGCESLLFSCSWGHRHLVLQRQRAPGCWTTLVSQTGKLRAPETGPQWAEARK